MLTKRKISLITCFESELSSVVTPQEAEDFLVSERKKPAQQVAQIQEKKPDDFDLLE